MTKAPSTCSSCGRFGHQVGRGGSCSKTGLAVSDVLTGALPKEAALTRGVRHDNLSTALRRAPGKQLTLAALRREIIRSRGEFHGRQRRSRIAMLDSAFDPWTFEECADVAAPPVSSVGADHAEIPDPPTFLETY